MHEKKIYIYIYIYIWIEECVLRGSWDDVNDMQVKMSVCLVGGGGLANWENYAIMIYECIGGIEWYVFVRGMLVQDSMGCTPFLMWLLRECLQITLLNVVTTGVWGTRVVGEGGSICSMWPNIWKGVNVTNFSGVGTFPSFCWKQNYSIEWCWSFFISL